MIRVTRQGDNPIPPWFLEELRLIDAEFFPFWDRSCERWLIARAVPSVFRKEHEIEFCVSKGKGYTPLDRRTLFRIAGILYIQNKMKQMDEHLGDLKDSDDAMALEALKQYRLEKREFMKKLYNFEHTETFT